MTDKIDAQHTLNFGKQGRRWLSVGIIAVTLQAPAAISVRAATTNSGAATQTTTSQLGTSTPAKEYPAASAASNIASGVYGTSQWWIDDQKVLHIGAGTLGEPAPTTNTNVTSYWIAYKDNVTKAVFEDTVVANPDSQRLFTGMSQLVTIDNLTNLDTSQVTNMNMMFSQCKALTNLDLSNFNTAKVTNIAAMFASDSSLQALDLSSFDTSQVTDMGYMFTSNTSLASVNVSSFDTSKVTDMTNMFMMCYNLTELNLANFDLRNIEGSNASNMVSRMPKLRKLTLSKNFRASWSYLRSDFGPDYSNHLWVNLNTGKTYTVDDSYSDNDLFESNYSSAETATDATYVWYYEPFTVEDATLTAGTATTWSAADNYVAQPDSSITVADVQVQVTDAAGHILPTVPTNTPGVYQVTYSTTDPISGYVYHQTAEVTILPSKTTVNVADQNLIVGPETTWTPADSFVSATNENGDPVDLKAVTVAGADQVDLTTPGQYPVTYTYTDARNNVVSQTAQVKVEATKAAIETSDLTLVAGPQTNWQASDSLVTATDATGAQLPITALTVAGADQVNLQVPGAYGVKYQYTDQAGNVITQPATVKVVASAASLTLKDSQLTVGQKWQASDNFVSGTDALGQPLELTQGVTIEGQVNTNQAGVYPLTYHYRDVAGNEVAQTITVTVLAVPDPVTPPTESIILPKTGPSTQPVSTTVQDSVVKRSITRTVTATAPTSITLPKTGERIERQLVTAGLALLGVTGLLALLVTRKRRN